MALPLGQDIPYVTMIMLSLNYDIIVYTHDIILL